MANVNDPDYCITVDPKKYQGLDASKAKILIKLLKSKNPTSVKAAMNGIFREDPCNAVFTDPLLSAATHYKNIKPDLYFQIVVFLLQMKERGVKFTPAQKSKLQSSYPWMSAEVMVEDTKLTITGKNLKLTSKYTLTEGTVILTKRGFEVLRGKPTIINGIKIKNDYANTQLSPQTSPGQEKNAISINSHLKTILTNGSFSIELLRGNPIVNIKKGNRLTFDSSGGLKIDANTNPPLATLYGNRAVIHNGAATPVQFSKFDGITSFESPPRNSKPLYTKGKPILLNFQVVDNNYNLAAVDFDNEYMPRKCVLSYNKSKKPVIQYKNSPVKKVDYFQKLFPSIKLEGQIPSIFDLTRLVKGLKNIPKNMQKSITAIAFSQNYKKIKWEPKKGVIYSTHQAGTINVTTKGGKVLSQRIFLPNNFDLGFFYIFAATALTNKINLRNPNFKKEWLQAAGNVYGKVQKKKREKRFGKIQK